MTDRDALWFVTEPESALPHVAPEQPKQPDEPPTSSDPQRRRRRLRWMTLSACGLLIGYFVLSLAQVWSTGRSDQARPVDAIVVLGAAQYDGRPSPQLAARLDHAAELYTRGFAPIVVVTGGKQPADRYTEAGASALYLIAKGVPPDAVLQEDRGRSTWESLDGVAQILGARNARQVLLVTDPYHSLRSRYIASELGLTAFVSPTRTSPVRGLTAFNRQIKEAAGISIGRVVGFERLWKVTG